MYILTTAIGVAVLVQAASATSCCFHLNASGGPGGSLGQLSDGQNRIGQGLAEAQYCIDSGVITDGSSRGCILTPPTTQFQCDSGATPSPGFSISCNGTLTHSNSEDFIACPTGDNGGYNIYTSAPSGQSGCVTVTLTADSCFNSCPTPSPSPAPAPAPAPQKTCPTALTGTWEYPHLIIPLSSSSPTTCYGTSYNGTVSPTTSTLFNFDIPSTDAGKTCSLIFLFPEQSQLQTSSYSFSGPGTVSFSQLSGPAGTETSWDSAPGVAADFGTRTVAPGGSYGVASFDCPAGQRVGFEMASVGGTELSWFQDYNPSAIGLYVTVC